MNCCNPAKTTGLCLDCPRSVQGNGNGVTTLPLTPAAQLPVPEALAAHAANFAQIAPEPTLYLWRPRIPLGDVTLFYGEGAVGKGRMLCGIIADVTNGTPVGTDTEGADPGDVIVIFPEDKPDEQVAGRLRASGADVSRVWDMTRLPSGSRFKLSAKPGQVGHLPVLAEFIAELRTAGRNPRLVVIDPLAAVVGAGSIQTNAGARQLLEPLQDMADKTGVAVIVVAHTVKSGRLQGSAGLQQAARVVYQVAVDPLDSSQRVITVDKANNLPPMDDLRFTFTTDEHGIARVEWIGRAEQDDARRGWRREFEAKLAARKATRLAKAG